MNVIAKAAITRLNFKVETHLTPFRVAWIDKTTIPVTEKYHIPLYIGNYKDKVYCVFFLHGCIPYFDLTALAI